MKILIRNFALISAFLGFMLVGSGLLAQTVHISGTIVDDETGKPIENCELDMGFFNKTTGEIGWGTTRTPIKCGEAGEFQMTAHYSTDYRYRIRAYGYFGEPILTDIPDDGKAIVEVRLQPCPTITGQVLDHEGKPVHAHVMETDRRRNFYVDFKESLGKTSHSIATDKTGNFKIKISDGKSLAVCNENCSVWVHPLGGDLTQPVTVRLPEPTKLTVNLDIKGAETKSEIFYQLLTHQMEGFDGVDMYEQVPISNGGSLELKTLPPGQYQFCRYKMMRHGDTGSSGMIDRTFVELVAGESQELNFIRKSGSQIIGRIQIPSADAYSGIVVTVTGSKVDPRIGIKEPLVLDSQMAGEYDSENMLQGTNAPFVTELLPPGEYQVEANGYAITKRNNQIMRTGFTAPHSTVKAKVTIPDDGKPVKLQLRFESPLTGKASNDDQDKSREVDD